MDKLTRSILLILIFSLILASMPVSAQDAARADNPLPKVWHISWPDKFTPSQLNELKAYGIDGIFKCVSGGEWRLVESIEGEYVWSVLETCLDTTYQANMWFIPEVVINVPPAWFIARYPNSLLKDSRGITELNPDSEGAPYILSPWFIASGLVDPYIEPFIDAFVELVSRYPNVPAVMLGIYKLNVLPWKMGSNSADNFGLLAPARCLCCQQLPGQLWPKDLTTSGLISLFSDDRS